MYISFDYYRAFYYVAKYGSISQAAEALMNNQPNVSRTIKNLESELNCTLFVRSRKGVELTPEGEMLYAHVAAAVEHIQSGEEEICLERTLSKGVVTIGASEIALRCFLLPVLKDFRQKYPGIRIRVFNHSTPQAVSALKNGLVDIAVVTTPTGELNSLTSKEICEVSEIPVCGTAFSQLAGKKLSLSELSTYPLISLGKQTKTYEAYSCMYSEFTKMSAGQPRLTQLERFRQRFMHKLVYNPLRNDGEFSCVGCGRCLKKCPNSLNIVKVAKTLGGTQA